ncbi:MAG: dTDP-glucose 4,6-dehydratase [Rickettsiales bacterium]|nr:dTDP-glucose 4,6-dehydratase [Rickettsiales bacterium]
MASSFSILVTGGAGFIGSAFVRLAASKGVRVTVLDKLTYAGGRDNLEGVDCELVEGDICDRGLVTQLLKERGIQRVAHFAAESHVDNSIAGPETFVHTNIVGTFALLEACREVAGKDFRLLHVSTDEVYGSVDDEEPFAEGARYRPNSPYSASKAASDHLARAWGQTYGLPVITTHCSNNYGPRQHPEKLIPTMILAALSGRPLPLYGDGKQVRDWLHVEDHCEGLWLALAKGEPGGVYHFSGGEHLENEAMVREICNVLERVMPHAKPYAQLITHVTDRPGHDRAYALNDTATRKALGFVNKHRLSTGLETTVEWYLANEAWCSRRQKGRA